MTRAHQSEGWAPPPAFDSFINCGGEGEGGDGEGEGGDGVGVSEFDRVGYLFE